MGLTKPPTPQEIPIPSAGVWIFSGPAQYKKETCKCLIKAGIKLPLGQGKPHSKSLLSPGGNTS